MEWFGACSRAEPISSQAAVFSTGVPLEVCVYEGFFLFSFFQCWLILNLSSLVDFKIKYRTIRDLLSHCLRVSNKNSPFVAVSVLGHFYNLFSSSVSKLTRLSCFHHSCLGGCSRSLLLWGSQAFCNKNVSPVLNSLIASLYVCPCATVVLPVEKLLPPHAPTVSFSSRHPYYSAYHRRPPLCQESWALSLKVISSNKDTGALWILCLHLKRTSAPSDPWEFSSQHMSFLSKNPPCGNSQTPVSLCVAKRILR